MSVSGWPVTEELLAASRRDRHATSIQKLRPAATKRLADTDEFTPITPKRGPKNADYPDW
jgi:hypothetical protein